MAVLYKAGQAVLSTFDLDEVLQRILAIAHDYFDLSNVAVLLLDALKGFAPTLAAGALGGPFPATLAAFAAIVGHCWSPFLGFKGGKGVATLLGTVIALWWPAGLAFALVWIALPEARYTALTIPCETVGVATP